jgi:two-component system, NtrC family, sensor histidine kinase PilS
LVSSLIMDSKVNRKYPLQISWRALNYYNLYRFLIAFLFVSLYWISQLPEPLGVYDQVVFAVSAHFYLFISIIALFFIQIRKPPFAYQVTGHVLLDILVITAFIYSSAGLNSGFGMLMVIAIAGGSILIPARVGFFFAAIATLCVLGHEVYLQVSPDRQFPNYIHAGFLGVTYFLTAFISHALATRVEQSEALAEKRAIDLQNLARLNEHIVQRLQSGIIVVDDNFKVRLYNESASNLLGVRSQIQNSHLITISPQLVSFINNWLNETGKSTFIIQSAEGSGDVQASLVKLRMGDKIDILIFLDDVSKLRQQAQQLKLASLGRLTASIAHEVRNPLGAISHAAQLLKESDVLDFEEKKLTSIITEQSVRVNSIIENVMRISRRDMPEPSVINLSDWLVKFIEEVISRHSLAPEDIKLKIARDTIIANMDPDQLYQVMWNICENGIRYSKNKPILEIRCDFHHELKRPFIEVVDFGNGIDNKIAENLFEPFITSEAKGTGLGLFIARELCEANQATLNLYANTKEGCIFRINFSHADKQQGIN